MEKNILVVGGSYFLGRIFMQKLSRMDGYSIHVLNRGRFPLRIPGVAEYKADRHDTETLRNMLPKIRFDAAVDFCAYCPGDARGLLESIPGGVGQYVYISSCAVFEPSPDFPKHEDAPKLSAQPSGPAGEYAFNKYLLELESNEVCADSGIHLTILRPCFVYGPYNYAPRESYYFNRILSGQKIPMPRNNLALFQFVYVQDCAQITAQCLCNPSVYNNSYNLAAPEQICYEKLLSVLSGAAGRAPETEYFDLEEILRQNIPLPFPLEQHELYAGEKIVRALGVSYTPFEQGIRESFGFYKKYVYK